MPKVSELTGLTSAVLALLADGHVLEDVLHVGTVGQRAGR